MNPQQLQQLAMAQQLATQHQRAAGAPGYFTIFSHNLYRTSMQ